MNGKLAVPHTSEHIVLSTQYKHIGVFTTHDFRYGPELAARRKAHTPFLGVIKKAICKMHIDVDDKVLLTDYVCYSKLFYAACTWLALKSTQVKQVQGSLVTQYRAAIQLQYKKHF